MTGCTYFSSDEWAEQLADSKKRTLNAKMGIWISKEIIDSEQALSDVVAETGYGRQDLSSVGISDVLAQDPDAVITLSREDPMEIKRSLISFPENCPHNAVGEAERCIFHMSTADRREYGLSANDVRDAFLKKIETDSKTDKIFIGARFETLDLEQHQLSAENNYPIRMEACKIEDTLGLERAIVEQPLFITGSQIESINCRDSEFRKDIEFNGVSFERVADFTYADFGDDAEFWNTSFGGEASFYAATFSSYAEFRDAHFQDTAQFKYVRVDRDVEFWDVHFDAEVSFDSMVVDGATEFRHAKFEGEAIFKEMSARKSIEFNTAKFKAPANFYRLTVNGNASFWETDFEDTATFEATHFYGYTEFNRGGRSDEDGCAHFDDDVTFQYSTFEKDVEFWCVTFEGPADFRNTVFRGTTEFHNAVFNSEATFAKATHKKVYFEAVEAPNAQIKLSDNNLPQGVISQPESSYTTYDLSEADVGDVSLKPQDDPDLFKHFRFYRTDFSGFDFPDHRRALNNNWSIHYFGDQRNSEEAPSELETTYLKAKNGASEVSDTTAASEFFVRERVWQRKSYFSIITSANSFRKKVYAGYKWATNWLYNLTCGYGEMPFRTVGFGALVIILFAIVFRWTVELPGENTAIRYVTFSIQTFVALLVGSSPTNTDIIIQFLVALEAFIGGFAIALFVFTLTKAIQR